MVNGQGYFQFIVDDRGTSSDSVSIAQKMSRRADGSFRIGGLFLQRLNIRGQVVLAEIHLALTGMQAAK